VASGDYELSSACGKPSRRNYFEDLIATYQFIHLALEREENLTVRPIHETLQWYQQLCFGLRDSRGIRNDDSPSRKGLAAGLSALLSQLDLEGNDVSCVLIPNLCRNIYF
jgi:hypothetical protein